MKSHQENAVNLLKNYQMQHYNALIQSAINLYSKFTMLKEYTLNVLPVFEQDMEQIYTNIAACEQAEIDALFIKLALHPVMEIMSTDFAQRMREWPRGYPGDFETIDYLYFKQNNHPKYTLKWLVEEYFYTLPVTQQHRNKVTYQANLIKEAILKNNNAKIAVLACGGGIDLGLCEDIIKDSNATIYINDQDKDAIKRTISRCSKIADRLYPIETDILRAVKKLSKEPGFNLVVAGGVFDYLNDKISIHLIHQAYEMLDDKGQFLFTNISKDNPIRVGMEYILNWQLIMRSQEDIYALCHASNVGRDAVTISKEDTNLTYLIELTK
ncbi:MAG: hypothetical protein P4L79_08635 [Legionella sp.]|uniref:hypothetical protein n=1 Tax=Legionella sp. TaxID=459 RepID=UPI00284175D7|nr:hypothetical protein [Legionella sp.]